MNQQLICHFWVCVIMLTWCASHSTVAQDDHNPFEDPNARKAVPKKKQEADQKSRLQLAVDPGGTGPARAVEKTLAENYKLELDETPLRELQKELREKTGINLVLHESAMNDGITEDEFITFASGKGQTLGESLESLLEDFNSDFIIEGNVAKVISMDDVDNPKFLMRKIIDARQLIALLVQGRMAQYADDPSPPRTWEVTMIVEEELVKLITESVNTDQWQENGGNATLVSINGLFVVKCGRRDLTQVQRLVSELQQNLEPAK